MTDIEKKKTCKKPGCKVGSWCVSSVNQHKEKTTNFVSKYNTTNDTESDVKKRKEQFVPLDLHKSAIKIGNYKFYFLKKTKENQLVSCQTWKVQKHGPETEERCSICLENYTNKDTAMKISCDHTFHKNCLLKWLQQHQRCPLCQNSVELTIYGEKRTREEISDLRRETLALHSSTATASSLFYGSGYTGFMF